MRGYDMREQTFIQRYHWKIHIAIALLLVLLSFMGVLLTSFMPAIVWQYWNISIPIFALLCMLLNLWDAHSNTFQFKSLLREIFHWGGILLTIYLVSIFVRYGLVSNIDAGLFVLTLLALGAFMAGIYLNKTFYIISFIQALFVCSTVLFIKYLIIISVFLLFVLFFLLLWRVKTIRRVS
jgi:hypothetical protein